MPRSEISDAELLAAADSSTSMSSLLRAVGLVDVGGNYASVRARLDRLGAMQPRFAPRSPDRPRAVLDRLPADVLVQVLAEALNLSDALRRLGVEPTSVALKALNDRARREGWDLATVRRARLVQQRPARTATPLAELLVRGSRAKSSVLARRLLAERLLPDCCAGCGGTSWMGCALPLELDHANGDRTDNRLENLRLLCPNCHALTPTWRGRNIARRRVRA